MAVNGAARNGSPYNGARPSFEKQTGPRPTVKQSTLRQRQQARQQKVRQQTTFRNKESKREYHIHINKGGTNGGGSGGASGEWGRKSPIGDADFLSAGHIREFSEKGRRSMREASMDLAYAAEALKQVLREVPPPQGQGRSTAYMRANRVARQLKRAASAAQAASAHCARTWPAFMREYAPELNTYGGPRPQARRNMNFGM
ncbi:plasmid transfer protein TraA [Streptomyces sp. NPDC051173]|uniref:plasmid transfer protein TraA n=1 Tax=Streptomyces sp. NPDC051173 TaxID=3155164 RepID=UPI00344C8F7C